MDKNTYETYEYLPTNNNEADSDQFLVVQDDGTFLLNRQIQYVAQVQDVKEALEDVQPCTVYGVSSQQFFVDVDNSSELISVSDQFILPDGDNGLYPNSYLLQPGSNTTNEQQMEEDVAPVEQYKPPETQDVDIDVVTHNSKQGNQFTEITLSDEQYHTLEQKGWILLESNDKIFVLNTLGLHDITTNDKLIQKLKNELQSNTNSETDAGAIKIENASNQLPNVVTQSASNQQETVEFVVDGNEQGENIIENLQFVVNVKENGEVTFNDKDSLGVSIMNRLQEDVAMDTVTLDMTQENSCIKINTKLNFKNIPEKIILGKTVTGKNLVAKVVPPHPANEVSKSEPSDETVVKTLDESVNNHHNVTGLHEAEFISLIQQTVRTGPQSKSNAEDVASADVVVAQLLQVPDLKTSLVGHNLIITKVSNNKDEFGKIFNRSKVTLVTGRAVLDDDDAGSFEHLPNLLQTIKSNAEEQNKSNDGTLNSIDEKEALENFDIFHIHITETKCTDNVIRVSVTLIKRQLPVNLVFDLKRRYPTTVFACSACATLFKTEDALKEHREIQCMNMDDMLMIDTDRLNTEDEGYATVKTGKETFYVCKECKAKFMKLSNCQRHLKTHVEPSKRAPDVKETKEPENTSKEDPSTVYKCKMCPSTYFHPSSLSKHIVAMHIKVKSK